MDLKGKKILITGGAGYIGNVIATLILQQAAKVRVIDTLWFKKDIPLTHFGNSNYEFIRGDLCDEEVIDKALMDIDLVIHAAAVVGEPASNKYPELTRRVNYDASVKLINKVADSDAQGLIYISTCSNYGITDGTATEESAIQALSLYAQTKVGVERYLLDKVKGLDWVICRFATVYGVSQRMRFDLTVNDFALAAYTKQQLDIFLPRSYRPYIHVYDVARVIKEICSNFNKAKNNIFNIGFQGENYQKIKIAEIVKKYLPATKIEILKNGADLRDYQVDFSKLKRFFGINNLFTVEDGVREVLYVLQHGLIKSPDNDVYYNTRPDLNGKI